MNRGSKPSDHRTVQLGTRFNEAPIHESGKCGRNTGLSYRLPGFNEAPIHESGKLEHSGLRSTPVTWLQ